ncbi:MAG: DinB family protein [Streptosporangiaceae bacterium]
MTDTTPPASEEDLVAVAGERETLELFLEYHRRALPGKLRGLSEQDARRRLVPSLTTLLGLVGHAAAVERNWFQHYLGGKPREQITGNARGDAPSWDTGAGQTIAGVIAEFGSACAASRQIAASFTLDQTVPHDQLGQVSLRFIYMNIISEHARHAGHADILREQIDGATGD